MLTFDSDVIALDQIPEMQYQLLPWVPITKPEAGKPAGSPEV